MTGDTFGDAATAVGAFATIGLLGAAIWAGKTAKASVDIAAEGLRKQIDEQRRIERRRRTYELLSTYLSGDFLEKTADAFPVLRVFDEDEPAGETRWNELSDAEKGTVTAVMNFYELVASEYNAGWLEREVADKHLAYATVVMWERARGLTGWFRRSDPRYFEQWKYLYDTERTTIEAASGLPQTPVSSPPGQ